MKRVQNLVITALVFCLGAGLLIWAAMDSTWVQTISAQDFLNDPAAYKSKSLQIFGKVVPESIKEQPQKLEFDLYWPSKQDIKISSLHIIYTGLAKVNLVPGSDVLIDCRIDGQGQVTANKILTKCPSKYTSRQDKKEAL